MNATNDESGRTKKYSAERDIVSLNQNGRVEKEVFCQLVKQTRGNENICIERNIWELFDVILKKIPCPEVPQKAPFQSICLKDAGTSPFVIEHVKQIAEDPGCDPLVRVRAYSVFEKLLNADCKDDLGEILERHPSSVVFRTDISVHSTDLGSVPVFYDLHSTVSEITEQLLWLQGIQNASDFALFEQRDYECLILDPNQWVCNITLRNHTKGQCHCSKFVVADKLSRVPKEENGKELENAFFSSRDKFTNEAYPCRYRSTVQLCAFLLFEEFSEPLHQCKANEDQTREIVDRYLSHRVSFPLKRVESSTVSLRIVRKLVWILGMQQFTMNMQRWKTSTKRKRC